MKLELNILYLAIATGFFGGTFLRVSLGSIHLFPSRIFIIILTFIFMLRIIEGSIWRRIHIKRYVCFFLFWLLYAALSILWAPEKSYAVKNVFFLLYGVLTLFFIVFYLNDLTRLKIFIYIWLGVIPILLGIGVWENISGEHLFGSGLNQWVNPYAYDVSNVRYQKIQYTPTASFGNPNDFAMFIVLAIPFLIAYLRYSCRKLIYGFIGICLLLASIYILILTESRANFLGMILEVIFLLFILDKSRIRRKYRIISFAIMSILLILYISGYQNTYIDDLYATFTEGLFNLSFADNPERAQLYLYALMAFIGTYGFGLGAGGIEAFMEPLSGNTGGVTNVHNWWLEILANYGFLVFIGYVFLYAYLFFSLLNHYKQTKVNEQKMLIEASLLGLVAFPISCISSSSIMGFMPQWAFLGFSLAVLNSLKQKVVYIPQNACLNHSN